MILAIPQFSANSPITCAECVSGTGCNNVNWYCVFGSRGSITPLHSASAPIVLAALHRRGLSWRTMGADALCKGVIDPLLPKTQYQFTLLHPVPETHSAHVIGELALNWGIAKIIPAVGQDPIYTIWRWNDCCTH